MPAYDVKMSQILRRYQKTGNHEKALEELETMERGGIPEKFRGDFYRAKGTLHFQRNEIPPALACFRRALEEGNDLIQKRTLCSNYLMYLHYKSGVTEEELRDAHFYYNELFSDVVPFTHARRNREKLRLGYLSSNLSDSIVVNFSVQLFAQYDRSRYEVILYDTGEKKDEVTQWLRGMVNGWRDLCYTPPKSVLECKRRYTTHRPVVFGSFNNFYKITDEMLALWRKILDQVPGSRLLLKNTSPDKWLVKAMRKRVMALGFRPEQLDLRPGSWKYLEEYMDMDIALDTYPYPGGGTTCEALYMGVPVVSRYGRRHGSRFGYSLLCNTGLEELTAETEEAYVEKAVALAEDEELLAALHRILRDRFASSPVMDAKGYVGEVEAAYERIWEDA